MNQPDPRLVCKERIDPATARVEEFRRLEGASDPDYMLAVAAVTCPRCEARGALVVNYEPVGSEGDALVLVRLEPPPPPSADAPSPGSRRV